MILKSIPVLYEDEHLLVINKPAGLVVHSDGRRTEPTLVDWLLEKYPSIKDVGDDVSKLKSYRSIRTAGELELRTPPPRPGIVHRLDRETSGALVVAKDQPTYLFLKRQFQAHTVRKVYHALLWGIFQEPEGMIDKPIGRSTQDFRKRTSARGAKDPIREALTYYRVLRSGGGVSMVEVLPKTGRTHQIRVHFESLHHPVVGDSLYAPTRGYAFGIKRLGLHARSLTFRLPTTSGGVEKTIIAPYPDDFENALKEMDKEG